MTPESELMADIDFFTMLGKFTDFVEKQKKETLTELDKRDV